MIGLHVRLGNAVLCLGVGSILASLDATLFSLVCWIGAGLIWFVIAIIHGFKDAAP